MLVRSVLNKSFDQNKLSELSISVSVGERQRKDCDMKNRISREKNRVNSIHDQEQTFPCSFSITVDSEMKTATTSSAFTVSFTLFIL